ncbi:MAG: TonB-dependent receptor [Dysgonamonadaceae bacterium]|jgi:TonB-linked SusC/RagA family outer membrane protein|nr:TonB-dependent receptor [Dysgonamonadaceae bacterium]
MKKVKFLFLFLWIPFVLSAQNILVSGTVKDKNGEALIGVSVMEKGTANGAVTNIDGYYSLNVARNATLQFSYIGYISQSIALNNVNGGGYKLDVILQEDTKALEEVVVIGYGMQRREAVTGSVASMQGEVLRDVQTGNITSALTGRVAGVQMTQTSSKPGDDMRIRIRGTRSFSGDNDPLVVLDGIPFAGTIGDINPNDIKSIDILKDASATAIYGSRGANGVIIVTTNKGTVGQKAKVTYNGYYGAKKLYHRYPMMTGDELYEVRKIAGVYKDTQGNPTLGADEIVGTDTDWQALLFDTGSVISHDIGITGGMEGGSYNFGAGYYNDQSVLPGQDYNRISLRASIDQAVGKYFRFGLTTNNNYNTANGRSIGMSNALQLSPLINPYNEDGSLKQRVSSVLDNNVWAYTRDSYESLGDKFADNQRGYASYNSLFGEVKAPFLEGLSYRINLGLNLRGMNRGQYRGVGVLNDAGTAASNGSQDRRFTTQWVVENLLTYDKSFDKHHINFTGMYSAEKTHTERTYITATNIPADFFLYWNLGQAAKADVTVDPNNQEYQEWGLESWMGRIMYDYDNRYMLSIAVRSDGSSRLAKGHQWHTYPAISAGWNIAKEDFMQNADWVNNLKLRLGWGQTSNQSVAPYATLGKLGAYQYNFGSSKTTGYYIEEVPNSELGWEYSITYNAGLDFSLLKNRLWGSIDYYLTNTKDILYKVSKPEANGGGSYWANVGKVQNKGLELALNGVIFDNKDGWSWDVGVNFYTNNNKITEISSGMDKDPSLFLFKNYSINSIYDYEKIGIWQENDPYLDILEPGGHAGMVKVKYTGEYNADGTPVRSIGADDRQIIKVDPDWQGGFNTRVAYKNWDLNLIGSYQHGGTLISALHSSNSYLNLLTGRRGQMKVDYWTPDNTGAKYPVPAAPQSGDNQKYGSTLGYFDATYFKLGQITLGYNFDPQWNWFKKTGLSSARLYFTLQNAFVLFSSFADETGLDPMTNSFGNENAAVTTDLPYRNSYMPVVSANTPQTRNFLFGLNLSF